MHLLRFSFETGSIFEAKLTKYSQILKDSANECRVLLNGKERDLRPKGNWEMAKETVSLSYAFLFLENPESLDNHVVIEIKGNVKSARRVIELLEVAEEPGLVQGKSDYSLARIAAMGLLVITVVQQSQIIKKVSNDSAAVRKIKIKSIIPAFRAVLLSLFLGSVSSGISLKVLGVWMGTDPTENVCGQESSDEALSLVLFEKSQAYWEAVTPFLPFGFSWASQLLPDPQNKGLQVSKAQSHQRKTH